MEMISEQRIPASRDAVWAALNNTEILKQAMPGCESFDAIEENKFEAKLTAKVGPVKAKFKFQVELSEINAPNGYTILGEGQGGVAGFAKGSAKVDLTEDGDETILAYNVQASVGGNQPFLLGIGQFCLICVILAPRCLTSARQSLKLASPALKAH